MHRNVSFANTAQCFNPSSITAGKSRGNINASGTIVRRPEYAIFTDLAGGALRGKTCRSERIKELSQSKVRHRMFRIIKGYGGSTGA